MKARVLAAFDKFILRKRSIIETINDQLKNVFNLEHSRHRSLTNFAVNVVACLVDYSYMLICLKNAKHLKNDRLSCNLV